MNSGIRIFLSAALMVMSPEVATHQQYFRVKPKDTEIVENHSADLQCHIGNQAGAVQWSKDGFVLGFDPDIPGYPRYSMIVDERRGVYNLRLRGVHLDDEGEYQCQVGPAPKNHPIRAEARVTVLVPPRKLEIRHHANGSTLEVREAERIALTCVSKHSKPAAKLRWYRNGVLLHGEETTGTRVHTTLSTITVYVIMDDNGATYTCEASHKALSQPLRTKITIDVLYPPGVPEIEGYQEGDIVQVGDTLTLACITRGGNPPAELIWYRDNVQVDMSYSTSGREVTNIHTFTVDATDNNAVYRCEASNSVTYHPRIASVKLSVLFAPSKIVILGPTEGKIGNTISMSCSAGPSNPPSELTWVVDGKPAAATSDIVVSRGGWLTTSNVTITLTRQDPDSKSFSCYAVSEALSDSIMETMAFSVVYPPSPPSILGYEEGTPIRAGDFQRFTCVAIGGNPLATLRWYKRDREVRAITTVSGSGVFSELVIRADASDNGATYRCEATNSATEKTLVAAITLTVHFPPSSVSIKTTPNRPRAGEMITIVCESGSSNPESTLHWWRNGEVFSGYDSESADALYGGKSTHSRLDLNVTSQDDEAIYTCQATNHVLQRSVHESVTLRVFFKPEFQVPNLENFDVIEGESILINLTARGNPAIISYAWRKATIDSPEISSTGRHKGDSDEVSHRVTPRGPLLEIIHARREDGGRYDCEATNSEGTGSTSIVVSVLYPAAVTMVTRSTVVSQGDDAFFECAAIGNPMRSNVLKWRRTGFDMSRTEQLEERGRSHLTVLNVTRSDAGVFECIAYNGIGDEAIGRAQLIVKFKPEVYLPKRFRKVATDLGETIRLSCLATGAPIVTFVWSFDGGVIKESVDSFKYSLRTAQIDNVTWESVLHVRDVKEEDFGEYTCIGRNEMGHGYLKVSLNKKGKPDPPENLQIENVTSDRVLLSWTPGFDGGMPQHFRIRYKEADSLQYLLVDVMPMNCTSFGVNGLVPGTEYTFSVMAWNAMGESDYGPTGVSAYTTSRRLPSTAVDAFAKKDDEVPTFLLVIIAVVATLLLLINAAIVVCYMQRKKKRQHTQEYHMTDNKSNPFASSMYSRDKYHDTINGEALRSPLNDTEDSFHEEILMKELMLQDCEDEKRSKTNHKCPSTKPYNGTQTKRWSSTPEDNRPDILKNGHNYGKDGNEMAPSTADGVMQEIRRNSLVSTCGAESTIFFPTGKSDSEATTALGVSAVELSSGKPKTLVIHAPVSENRQSINCIVDGHFI